MAWEYSHGPALALVVEASFWVLGDEQVLWICRKLTVIESACGLANHPAHNCGNHGHKAERDGRRSVVASAHPRPLDCVRAKQPHRVCVPNFNADPDDVANQRCGAELKDDQRKQSEFSFGDIRTLSHTHFSGLVPVTTARPDCDGDPAARLIVGRCGEGACYGHAASSEDGAESGDFDEGKEKGGQPEPPDSLEFFERRGLVGGRGHRPSRSRYLSQEPRTG